MQANKYEGGMGDMLLATIYALEGVGGKIFVGDEMALLCLLLGARYGLDVNDVIRKV
jgi:hypothetical protein